MRAFSWLLLTLAGCLDPRNDPIEPAAPGDAGPRAAETPPRSPGSTGPADGPAPAMPPLPGQPTPRDAATPPPDAAPAPTPDAAILCGAGSHLCGTSCALDSDPGRCGPECKLCPTPANGTPVCRSGDCDVTCASGHHACDKSCFADVDPNHCGEGCLACPAVPGGQATCRNGKCDATCNAGTLACTGLPPACVVTSWNFESARLDGWLPTAGQSNNANFAVSASAGRAHGGSRALATVVDVNFARDQYVARVDVPLCASGGIDVGGKTITLFVYLDGPALPRPSISGPYVYTTEGSSFALLDVGGQDDGSTTANSWIRISGRFPPNEAHVLTRLGFFTNFTTDGWRGTLYLDDITIE